jgi:hypothetical protein
LELAVLVLDFVEQPHVLDRYYRMVGEGFDQFDLISVNGRTKVRSKWDTPIGIPWHSEQRAITAFLLSFK